MKSTRTIKSKWQSILSLVVLSIFVFMGGICWTDATPKPVYTYNPAAGTATKSINYPRSGQSEVTTGKWDASRGLFDGPVTITYTAKNTDPDGVEEVNMKDGVRHGRAIYTYPDGNKETRCYQYGSHVDPDQCGDNFEKSAVFSTDDNSAYGIFIYEVPWYAFKLHVFAYDSDYVQAYLDTLELLLYSSEFSEDDFGDYYGEVIDALGETAYDSIIQLNDVFSFYNGMDLILDNEFRLATIDSYKEGDGNTYQVIQSNYPNYLLQLNTAEVTNSDFEGFCSEYDSIMSTYIPMARDDPSFIDSLEERMYRTLDLISSDDESSESKSTSLKSAWSSDALRSLRALRRDFYSQYKNQALNYTPQEVSEVVLFLIIIDFFKGDLIQSAVADAYAINKSIVQLPSVVTDFSGNTSSTSVTLYGNVIDDGGGEVTSRGIAWASFYNPTIDNQVLSAGSGTGEFEISLEELTEGETYYARSFATNSAGTAYGNSISFIAQNTTGIVPADLSALDYSVYPNPASDHITLTIRAENSKAMVFTLYDLNGKVILQKELASLVQGENMIRVDLSDIESGSYICRLKGDENTNASRILLITR
jgi:hypothetical protein